MNILIFIAAVLCSAYGNPVGDDFYDQSGNYEFIFHKEHSLLLVIHDNKCYYIPVKADIDYDYLSTEHRLQSEEAIKHMLDTENYKVHDMSMGEAREHFKDLLADFRCLNHDLYLVYARESTTTAPMTPAASGQDHGHHGGTIHPPITTTPSIWDIFAFGAGAAAGAAAVAGAGAVAGSIFCPFFICIWVGK